MAGELAQQQFSALLRRLTGGQKVLLVVVTLGVLAALVALVTVVNKPTFATLYGDLELQDASKVVEKLQERKIDYVLENGGRNILVPRQNVYDLRLALAGEGLPQSSVIGYEIFDRTNLGVSDFVQRVNYRRALQLNEVEGVRVHLVVPERTLFREDQKPATASVVLKLKSGRPLGEGSVQGIAHLVASSVEGLESENVTIIDARGGLLSSTSRSNSIAALSSTQYELQQRVESYLSQKAQSLLEGVVGAGNAIVQVNAELDFRQVERTLEQYDPEATAVRSEQITEEKMVTADTVEPSTRASTVTNYEVNKSVEHIVEGTGNIRRLSVAALVNGVPRTVQRDGQTITEIVPRPNEEMDKLTDLVHRAVGVNLDRKDEITVTTLSFGPAGGDEGFVTEKTPLTDFDDLPRTIFLIAAMVMGVLVLRSLLNRFRVGLEPGEAPLRFVGDPALAALRAKKQAIHLPSPEDEISTEALIRAERKKRISEYIHEKPVEGSRLLKVWLAE
jgi:flagellar M-ring protein FliF